MSKKYSKRASFYTGSIPVLDSDFIIMSGTFNFSRPVIIMLGDGIFTIFKFTLVKIEMCYDFQFANIRPGKNYRGGIVYSSQKR